MAMKLKFSHTVLSLLLVEMKDKEWEHIIVCFAHVFELLGD